MRAGVVQNDQLRSTCQRCAVIGLFDKPLRLCAEGTVQTIAARFFAWGFFPLFQTDVQHLPDSIHPLAAPWQTLADQMTQAIEAGDLEAALNALHAYLLNYVLTHHFEPREIQEAARRIADQHGHVSITALADQCHYSHRQLERKFNQAVRMTPKALARKIRFERVRDHLTRDPHVNLATLAHDYGYADQAHLARDFKHYSEKTLTEFACEMTALHRWMGETYDVVFLQDPARSS
jgi:AraC-like DNA-binding protein